MSNRAQNNLSKCRLENKEAKIIAKLKLHGSSSIIPYNHRKTNTVQ